jgi:hypothetical protein
VIGYEKIRTPNDVVLVVFLAIGAMAMNSQEANQTGSIRIGYEDESGFAKWQKYPSIQP